VRSIVEGTYDLLLLDMTMRNYDVTTEEEGGRPRNYAGRLLLLQMDRRDITVPAILITQFDTFIEGGKLVTLAQLDADLARQFPMMYNGAIYYDAAVEGWKRELREKIERLFGGNTGDPCEF